MPAVQPATPTANKVISGQMTWNRELTDELRSVESADREISVFMSAVG
jgi:hypothetical protein